MNPSPTSARLKAFTRLARHRDDPDPVFGSWTDVPRSPEFRHWDVVREIEAISCPVLATRGENDEYGTLAQIHALARMSLSQTELLVLAASSHFPHRDRPEELIRAAGRFIAESG